MDCIKVRGREEKEDYSQNFIMAVNNRKIEVEFFMWSYRVTGCDFPR